MPTFTATALDELIEPGAAKHMAALKNGPNPKLERKSNTPNTWSNRGTIAPRSKLEKSISVPNSNSNGSNVPSATMTDRKHHWTQISPALYATPEPTPLPDSPSSFPPSPYIINHKQRGPRLLKSFSQDDVAIHNWALNEKRENENAKDAKKEVDAAANKESVAPVNVVEFSKDDVAPSVLSPVKEEHVNGVFSGEVRVNDFGNSSAAPNGTMKLDRFNLQRNGEADDFFDPRESMSVNSNADSESNYGVERSANVSTPMMEFYDAWEELSSESGAQPSMTDLEAELHEIRLNLLMEIEKQKQAEEKLNTMRAQWQKIQEELSVVGHCLQILSLFLRMNS